MRCAFERQVTSLVRDADLELRSEPVPTSATPRSRTRRAWRATLPLCRRDLRAAGLRSSPVPGRLASCLQSWKVISSWPVTKRASLFRTMSQPRGRTWHRPHLRLTGPSLPRVAMARVGRNAAPELHHRRHAGAVPPLVSRALMKWHTLTRECDVEYFCFK